MKIEVGRKCPTSILFMIHGHIHLFWPHSGISPSPFSASAPIIHSPMTLCHKDTLSEATGVKATCLTYPIYCIVALHYTSSGPWNSTNRESSNIWYYREQPPNFVCEKDKRSCFPLWLVGFLSMIPLSTTSWLTGDDDRWLCLLLVLSRIMI